MNDIDVNHLSDAFDFDRSLPTMLIGALDACLPAYRAIFAANGLTEQQWRVLRVLWSSSELTSVEIAARTFISKPSLVGVLDRLEGRGLIERWRDCGDRRLVRARLTEAGKAMRDAIAPKLAAVQAQVNARLSADEWEEFRRLLSKATDMEGRS